MLKRITTTPAFQAAVGFLAAWYLRLAWYSCRRTIEPADIYEIAQFPLIVGMWHGQHFMAPFIKRDKSHRTKVLISRHRDGEMNARAAENLGIGTIRGSGTHSPDFHKKGGAAAFPKMVEALADGYNIAMTADIPKISRVAGMGIVKLAQHSGRPIYAVAIASSRRIQLKNWDRTAINLPFGRVALVAGEPIFVPRDADKPTLETIRQQVERELNRVTARAYEIADRTGGSPP